MRAIIVVLALVLCSPPAFAFDPDGTPTTGGGVDGGSFFVGIIAPGRPGSSGAVGSPAGVTPYTYTWVPPGTVVGGLSPACDAGGAPGIPYGLVVRDLGGAVVSTETRCVPLNADGSAAALPALPPVPSTGEIWRAALRAIDPPGVGVNPAPTGLTGLETWFWYDGPTELQVATGIGPWTVTGTARVNEVTFDLGDGETATSSSGGSEAEPAVRHVYETKGTYTVTVTARWVADLVLSGPGLPSRPTPIGTAVLRSTADYPVQEVRALLVPDR